MPTLNKHLQTQACTQQVYKVSSSDLPLACPSNEMRIWDAHPRVYLPIEDTGEAVCPYCDAHYILMKET